MKFLLSPNKSTKKLEESEVIAKINSHLNDTSMTFKGFVDDDVRLSIRKTKIYCEKHKVSYNKTVVNSLLNSKQYPCNLCRAEWEKEKVRLRQTLHATPYLFNFTDVKTSGDGYVSYFCYKCESVYGNGWYKKAIKKLGRGNSLCGCSPFGVKNKTKDMYTCELKYIPGNDYRFLFWKEDKITSKSRFKYLCEVHGIMEGCFWDWK
ncbi:hypothetical protein VPHF99_0204 [Vibrio phage F99]